MASRRHFVSCGRGRRPAREKETERSQGEQITIHDRPWPVRSRSSPAAFSLLAEILDSTAAIVVVRSASRSSSSRLRLVSG